MPLPLVLEQVAVQNPNSKHHRITAFNRVMADGDAFNGATPGDAPAEDTYVFPGFCL